MGTLKVETGDEILERFRKKAMEEYGYKRGSLKKATENLMKKWLSEEKIEWGRLKGVITSKDSSVELQHRAWRRVD
ncbi:MAG: hypothetical protein GXO65_06210 [Euryarchaeota archaeon]|nr:hypothetical protein [Euryarchaeota archaeon]